MSITITLGPNDIAISYFQASVFSLAILSTVILFSIREIFKPPHWRQPPKGKRWKLPPGPPGIPVVGNLLQFRDARRDEITMIEYVGCDILTWVGRQSHIQAALVAFSIR